MTYKTKSQLRKAGILFIVFFLIPYLIHQEFNSIVILFSLIVFSLSFVSPYSLRKPYNLWIKFGNFLGKINSTIILILFFYVLVTPVALIRRLFNRIFSKNKRKSLYMKSVVSYKNFNFKDQF